MKPDTKTSFGDANQRTDLVQMRDWLNKRWEQRQPGFFRSPAEREGQRPDLALPELAVDRRGFMKLMGGSMALAGLTACTKQPKETIVPYVNAPEEIVPGKPLYYATCRVSGGFAQGLLVESHMGRPTKVEGHKAHPASLGGTDAFSQASVLDLYDPDRSQAVLKKGRVSTYKEFQTALAAELDQLSTLGGKGIHVVLPASSSPTEAALLEKVLAALPELAVHRHDPVGMDQALQGATLAFGKPLQANPRYGEADVILSLDADFLREGPAPVRAAHDYASRRRVVDGVKPNRLYCVESTTTTTGVAADHRLAVRAARVEAFARALAVRLGLGGEAPTLSARESALLDAVTEDLSTAGSRALIVVGEHQPPVVHGLALALNSSLGAVGTTLDLIDPVLLGPLDSAGDFARLVSAMRAGEVKVLLMLGVNPVYTASADLRFANALRNVPFSAHLGLYRDETADLANWHIPQTHGLETWGDARAYDGTITIAQPLIAPLYAAGKSVLEVLSLLTGSEASAYQLVQETWKSAKGLENDELGFTRFWRKALHDGVVEGTASPPLAAPALSGLVGIAPYQDPKADFGLELVFRVDPRVGDGAFANNPWMQECPAPVSTLTWDHVITMSAKTAAEYGITLDRDGVQKRTSTHPRVQVIELNVGNAKLRGPVLVLPGHPDNSMTITLGGGRRQGRVAKNVGYDAYSVRQEAARWVVQGVTLLTLGKTVQLALTQDHFWVVEDGRNLVRVATAKQAEEAPDFPSGMGHAFDKRYTLFNNEEWDYTKGNQWGMVIDLSTCIGCSACVVACQAENNIATVGKKEVMNGREMHWIRVDRYFEEKEGTLRAHYQPMACVHCENAPCETVCPVGATMHSNDGLNMMVYNRCVGTRYCSNNCPYKVRRYNFYKFTDDKTESLKLQRNPDVTVRLRGVMEKCTYCVQRINLARIDAKVDPAKGGVIADGTVVTACQQACPTQAISFGDINDPHSRVAALKAHPLNYTILEVLNTRARTSYLGKVRNPNLQLEPHHPLELHHAAHGHGHEDISHAPEAHH